MPQGGVVAQESEPASPSRDTVFEVLSNERRRYVLRALREREDAVEIGPLAEQVAAWENDIAVKEITYEQRKRVYTALQQSHLPKMDEAGALQFDKNRGTVAPAEDISAFDIYLEVVPSTELPRSEYYVGLGAASVVLSVVVALGLYPFRLIPEMGWVTVAVILFGVSALVHLYAIRHPKLREYSAEPDE